MHIPEKLNIRWYVALPCLLLSFVIGWFNRPDFLESPSCMTCGLDFVAEPGIGEYGLLPLYLTQMFLFIAGLLWISAAMKNAFAGKVSAYFGRRSLMMLVIHGWIIVTLYQFPLSDLPPHDSIFFYISLICTVVILHAAVFAATQPVLWRFMTIISRVSAGIVSVLDWTKSSRSDEPQEYAATAKF